MEPFSHDAQEIINRVLQQFPVSVEEQLRLERLSSSAPAADEACRLKATLFWYHPRSWVDAPVKPDRLCFLVPSEVASSAAWRRFRQQLSELQARCPADMEYPRHLMRADEVLIWRALIPPQYRFWKADGETNDR